jgi:hypothetical protein
MEHEAAYVNTLRGEGRDRRPERHSRDQADMAVAKTLNAIRGGADVIVRRRCSTSPGSVTPTCCSAPTRKATWVSGLTR